MKVRIILTIIGIAITLFLPSASAQEQAFDPCATVADDSPMRLDVYLDEYCTQDESVEDTVLQRTLKQLNRDCHGADKLTVDDLRAIAAGNALPPQKKCQTGSKVPLDKVTALQDHVFSIVKKETTMAAQEWDLAQEVRMETMFSDVRTDNTIYDLMVDLNIIDVIWFGEQAEFSRPPWGGFGKSFTRGEYDPARPETLVSVVDTPSGSNENENGNSNGSGGGSGTGNGNGSGGGSRGNGNTNSSTTPVNRNANGSSGAPGTRDSTGQCPSPGDPQFDSSTLDTVLQDVAEAEEASERDPTAAGDVFVTDSDPRPLYERPYVTAIETSPVTDEDPVTEAGDWTENVNTLSNQNAPSDKSGNDANRLLCNSFFCVKVSLKKGVALSTVSDNSVFAHSASILSDIRTLRGYNLALGSTSSGFLEPGMFKLNFGNLSFNASVRSKPIWNPNKYTYRADEVKKIRSSLLDLRTKALTTSCYDLSLGVNQSKQQESAQHTARECQTRLEKEWVATVDRLKQEARKRNETDLKPLEDEMRQMREALLGIVKNFKDVKEGITKQAQTLSTKETK